jgi:hypothetical protein
MTVGCSLAFALYRTSAQRGSGKISSLDKFTCEEFNYPFGHGLNTTYEYSDLVVTGGRGEDLIVSGKVKNTGSVAGSRDGHVLHL